MKITSSVLPIFCAVTALAVFYFGCSGSSSDGSGGAAGAAAGTAGSGGIAGSAAGGSASGGTASGGTAGGSCLPGDPTGAVDPTLFDAAGLVTPITEEPCTLSNGAETTCYRITLKGAPSNHDVGPFCPRNISDDAESAGIWLEGGEVYDADGAFIKDLASFYNDPAWQLYDETTGAVRVTDTQASCEAAARPDVDPAYNNYCVECSLDYVGGGVDTVVLLPKLPVARASASEIGRADSIGTSLSGVVFDPPAPVDAILGAHTIAAFDDCGGHVNPVAGYHYHAATGCSREVATCDAHAPLIGYALDGYAIYAQKAQGGAEPADLDECRGHEDALRGYHYHAASAGENMFIGCFHGETVGDAGGPGDPAACAPGQTSMCCGDGVCDGPETAATCAKDCS